MNQKQENRTALFSGMKGGIPIGLAYLAVGFSIGITCRNTGLHWLQALLLSFGCVASAGEYAALTVMAADAAYTEIIIITIVASARYLLMGCALTQRLSPRLPYPWRFVIGYGITDEIFAISVSQKGYLNPWFNVGAIVVAVPCWALGKVLGVLLGNVLPPILLAAFSVALYGMFISIVVVPARKEKAVLACVLSGWALSWAATKLPLTASMSEGTRTILLTILIGVVISLVFPYDSEAEDRALAEELAKKSEEGSAV